MDSLKDISKKILKREDKQKQADYECITEVREINEMNSFMVLTNPDLFLRMQSFLSGCEGVVWTFYRENFPDDFWLLDLFYEALAARNWKVVNKLYQRELFQSNDYNILKWDHMYCGTKNYPHAAYSLLSTCEWFHTTLGDKFPHWNRYLNTAINRCEFDLANLILKYRHEGCLTNAKNFTNEISLIDRVQVLHEYSGKVCAMCTMDQSVSRCILNLFRFIYQYRYETSLKGAMLWASFYKHVDIVHFLLENQGEKCAVWAVNCATANGYLEIVRFLHNNRSEGTFSSAMNQAAAKGRLDVVRFLHKNRDERYTTEVMDLAAKFGHLKVIEFLHCYRLEGCTTSAMNNAAKYGHLKTVKFLHKYRREGCTTSVMDKAAKYGHFKIIKFLHKFRTEGCTTDAMDYAAEKGYLNIVQFLHENRTEGCTSKAMDQAAANGHLEVVQFLHHHRTEGCSTNAMKLAATNGHLEVVHFLFHHRTAG